MNENQQFEFLDIISFAMQLMNQQNISRQVTSQELRIQDSKYLQHIMDQNNQSTPNFLRPFLSKYFRC